MPIRETEIISEEEIERIAGKDAFEDIKKARRNIQSILSFLSFFPLSEEEFTLLLKSVISSPDPDMGLNNFERLFAVIGKKREIISYLFQDMKLFPSITKILGTSFFLSNIIIKNPDYLLKVLNEEALRECKNSDRMISEIYHENGDKEAELSPEKVTERLRLYKNREFLRIAARDILGIATLAEVTEELSCLASACLETAYRVGEKTLMATYGAPLYRVKDKQEKESKFSIIGLGKLGGWELNYCSDIDLIYIYSSDDGETSGIETDGKKKNIITLHEYYTKLADLINKFIGSQTEEGNVFRLDLRLRPEGRSGDMANSLRSMEIYYESWGQTWERQMLIKAKPVAGDKELGGCFLETIKPFIYRKHLDFQAIEEIKEMKEKINLSVAANGGTYNNVKLGYGGIREIEFFTQTLQLIYGGRNEKIREVNTLKALRKLNDNGYISFEDYIILVQGYSFLRTVEHRIQLLEGRQDHSMPAEEKKIKKLARRVGYSINEKEKFLSDYSFFTKGVRKIFDKLFYESKEGEEKTQKEDNFSVLWEGLLSEEDSINILAFMGFSEPDIAYKNLKLLRDGKPFSHFSGKSKDLLREVAPVLFKEITKTPDPDMALNNLEKFISTSPARTTMVSLLAESSGAREILLNLFGTSEFISNILIRHPEYIDITQHPEFLEKRKSREESEKELLDLLRGKSRFEEKSDLLRKYRTEEILRIGLRDIILGMSFDDITKEISILAEVCLKGAYEMSIEELKEEFGIPQIISDGVRKESGFAIFGLGKLGGTELNYSSDLDVIFVYSDEGDTETGKISQKKVTNQEFFSKLAIKILQAMNEVREDGMVFKVDARLRPSGSSGYLAQSIKAYENYFETHLQLWERQALIKTRFIAGDNSLDEEFLTIAYKTVYEKDFTKEMASEIDRMRKRMETELAHEDESIFHLKFGEGGIVDIEFVTQALQLKYGKDEEKLRNPNTISALKELEECGHLEKSDYLDIINSYKFLRMVENRLRIVQDRPLNILFKSPEKIVKLAKRMGYKELEKLSPGAQLLRDYENYTERVREIYNKYFNLLCE
ncbi:MAG: hypothetical protein A2042_00125 [Candidatus Schekmanbacteria bacterium GWA2_38_11]|uniref:Glutamine-synthetase adenylyltransferase n=1 Tax=Candidatus Schekmanbacteria bacterium GWA2_38_11 TaxID=1817876 RepID=A0A1F7RE75_9BACT|nr:MAG: hypothetical protein A2042_00125 [Candidatus Schekmanbacteria bacterium GWA2_38_11]